MNCNFCGYEDEVNENGLCEDCKDEYSYDQFTEDYPGYVHSDLGDPTVMAVNIKYYQGIDLNDESDAEMIWEVIQTQFFDAAHEIAVKFGYTGCLVTGRSGGWLYPYYQGAPKRFWSGQGGFMGYPRYPSFDSRSDAEEFMEFANEIESLLEEVPGMIKDEIEWCLENGIIDG